MTTKFLRQKKIIVYFIAAIMILGGIMGLIKNNIPSLANFDFRHIFMGTIFTKPTVYALYIRIYGTVMAILEIFTFPVFIKFSKAKVYYIIAVLCLNAAVCLISLIGGDIFAALSLLIRLIAIALLVYAIKTE